MNRFYLCLFLCGLLLIGDGRRHAGAVVLPLAMFAAGALIAVYAGVSFHNAGSGVAMVAAGNIIKNYVADFQGNMVDAVFTGSATSVKNEIVSNPEGYPIINQAIATNNALSPYVRGAYSTYYCERKTTVATMPKYADSCPAVWLSPTTSSCDLYGIGLGYYVDRFSCVPQVKKTPEQVVTESVGLYESNIEITRALDQLFQSGNQNHSEIPTNGITLADGRTITMTDLIDTANFKKSQDDLNAMIASRAAFDTAASITAASSATATIEKNEADSRLAAAAAAMDIAVADAAANPTDSAKQALADKYINVWTGAKTDQTIATQTETQAKAAAAAAAAQAAAVAASQASLIAEDARFAATPDPILPPPAFYDPNIEAPEKKDIPTLLQSFVANSPLSGALQAVVVSTSNANSAVLVQGKIFGQDMKFDFSRFDSSFRAVGAFAVLIYQGMAILFVIRGDNVVRGGSK